MAGGIYIGAEQVRNMSEVELKGMLESVRHMEERFGEEADVIAVKEDC